MVEDVSACVDGVPTVTEGKTGDLTRETFGDVLDRVFVEHGLSEDDAASVWESLRGCGVVRGDEASVWWTHELQGGVEEALKAADARVTEAGLTAALAEFGEWCGYGRCFCV